jgi:hypothetical protein
MTALLYSQFYHSGLGTSRTKDGRTNLLKSISSAHFALEKRPRDW